MTQLLISTDFSISYKLNDNIHTLTFDHTYLKEMNLNTFSEFLQIQYENVVNFYTELQQKYSYEYIELFPEYNSRETIPSMSMETEEAFTSILPLYTNEFTTSQLEKFLEMSNIERFSEGLNKDIMLILTNAIKEENIEAFEVIINKIKLNYTHFQVIVDASKKITLDKNIQIFKMLFDKMENVPLDTVIWVENLPVLEFLLNRMEIKNCNVIQAIQRGNPEMVKMLFDKIDVVNQSILDEVSILGSPLIFRLVLDKIGKSGNLVLSNIIKTANPFFVKLALDKMEKVDVLDVAEAIKLGNQNILKLVLDKMINPSYDGDIIPFYSALLSGNQEIIKITLNNLDQITCEELKIVSNIKNQEIIDLAFNKFGTIPEWLLFDSIRNIDKQSFTELLLNKMPQVSITAAYYALKVGNLEAISKILNKVDINYVKNGDKEFCHEIAYKFGIEQNQEITKQLEQYLVAQPEFNIADQLESKVMSIIGNYFIPATE